MVKVQRVRIPNSEKVSWIVLDDNYAPIEIVSEFLRYLLNIERSPNTIRSYANHLKLYWEFLQDSSLEWDSVKLSNLAEFISWLRKPDPQVLSLQQQETKRTEATVNAVMSSVCMLYDFHERSGKVPHIPLYRSSFSPGRRYKSFLHHINKGKPVRTRLLKLKEPKRIPKTLSREQIDALIDGCSRVRDKFLICLLQETGMRIGQAIGLRHEDIESWDNTIQIVPREDNANGARAKTVNAYSIHTSKELMALYTEYLEKEFMEILGDHLSDYVFVNLWGGNIGAPMSYNNVMALFTRLKRKTGIAVHPHMLRHTHATELIREGVQMAYVQKRLGHANIQTTLNTYVHLSDEDMKEAYQEFVEKRDGTCSSAGVAATSNAT